MPDLSAVSDLPVIEIGERTDEENPPKTVCEALAACLRDTGLVVVRDARVPHSSSARFIDLMEKYFEQEREEKMKDARPELRYQVGVKPEGVETPLCVANAECQELMQSLEGKNKATAPSGQRPPGNALRAAPSREAPSGWRPPGGALRANALQVAPSGWRPPSGATPGGASGGALQVAPSVAPTPRVAPSGAPSGQRPPVAPCGGALGQRAVGWRPQGWRRPE
ncbi:hypothetical protein CYMTET_52926 [Cymbomonas tetramitiformis]|uniref:Non-haem dioxygenase N-terminal domain-containing protein n=1 Tax=Cymbomonas tetramitiformis TaxID=36881 RepID=A0AAE0BHZ9_9CHLO|nr:hypothetical protein CYMTET_52926 [Cymbomonas tetramitiformis]